MATDKVPTQFSVTSSDNAGLRMKIAIPRTETTTSLCTTPIAKRRGRPRKKTPASGSSSSSNGSSDSSDDEPNQQATKRAKRSLRQPSGNSARSRNANITNDPPPSSSSSSSSDVDEYPGNRKRRSQSAKIHPIAASTPAITKVPAVRDIKRRPGRPPKKPVSNFSVAPNLGPSQPSQRLAGVRLSLADGASSSDNDAFQAISAAISRAFESGGSDTELNGLPGTPSRPQKTWDTKPSTAAAKAVLSPIQYTSSLLRDFVEKTQKLGQQQEANVIVPDQTANSLPRESSATNWEAPSAATADGGVDGVAVVARKKRGRPPKKPPAPLNQTPQTTSQVKTDRLNSRLKLSMRDSPDSGILSVNQSPSNSPRTAKRAPTTAGHRAQVSSSGGMLMSLEKPIYPTERVLYPPRNVKRGRPPLNKAKDGQPELVGADKGQGVDPMWRKIDINMKFHRPTDGYKSDGGSEAFSNAGAGPSSSSAAGLRGAEGSSAVCSKVLAAQCGYASDYGSVRKSRQSGYRSDYSTRSRKSGYRSDCSVRRKLRRKKRAKSSVSGCIAGELREGLGGGLCGEAVHNLIHGPGLRVKATATFDERDLLQLAGLSLGNSSDDDSGNDGPVVLAKESSLKGGGSVEKGLKRELVSSLRRHEETFGSKATQFLDFDKAKFERDFIMNYRALVAESRLETEAMEAKINEEAKARLRKGEKMTEEGVPKYNCFENFSNVLPIIELKSKRTAKSIRSRRSSAVSRCSSRSNRSMHHKHRRKRLKSKSESGPAVKLAEKLRLQLEHIVETFGRACKLFEQPAKALKEVQKQTPPRAVSPTTISGGTAAAVGKVKEKKEETTKAAQKRGVKKRKCSENTEHTGTPSGPKRRAKKEKDLQSPDDHKLPLKKRHYLLADGEGARVDGETKTEVKDPATPKGKPTGEGNKSTAQHDLPDSSTPPITQSLPITPRGTRKGQDQQQHQEKKSKLPSPNAPAPRGRPPKSTSSVVTTVSLPDKLLSPVPPPGVFEPTMDLELQIPISTIVISGTSKSGGLLTMRTKVEKDMDSPSLKKKRKKFNRTGFPTVKKKKKRQTPVPGTFADIMPDLKLEKCDRVPTYGEATSKFLERNELKRRLAVVSVERLQAPEVSTRSSRSKDSPALNGDSRDASKEPATAPEPPTLAKVTKKVKLEEPEVEEAPDTKKPKRRSATLSLETKTRRIRGGSIERTEEAEKSTQPQRRISLLEEISPHKRQSIRNLAKSLMVSEAVPKKEVVLEAPKVVAKKIDPRKRRMTVAVLETPKLRPALPTTEESPTAIRDIKPAPISIELEQDALPVEENEEEEVIRTDTPSSEISDRSNSKRMTKWKKKYLPAGLFSEYYKEGEKDRSTKAAATKDPEVTLNTPAVLLQPPPYCEKFFRQSIIDFQLPYDLWWAHDNQKLPGRDTIASWTFKKIRTNVYLAGRPNPKTDLPSCNCKPSSGCIDDCLNRMVYTECSPDTCPCEDKCQNTKIQRHEFASGIERFMTDKKGWGVRTKQAIRKSQFIIEYLGEVVTEREFKERMGTVYAKDTHHYCLHLDGDLVIDGHRMGSDCRFVNHSCTPNCEVQKWNVNGLSRMCLFALRDIKPGEELTYDYNFALYNPSEGQPCKCDSKDCRGVIGGKSQRVAKVVVNNVAVNAEDAKGARNRKRQAKKKNQSQNNNKVRPTTPLFQIPTGKEVTIIRESHCFLMRNLMKVRKQKDTMPALQSDPVLLDEAPPSVVSVASSGSIGVRRTRAIKGASEETDESLVQFRLVFLKICTELLETKCEANELLMSLPPKKKLPNYYDRFERPIDLTIIHGNADKWVYSSPKAFDDDIMRMLRNALEFFEAKSEEHVAAQNLQNLYETKKWAEYQALSGVVPNKELLREFEPPTTNELELKVEPNEDIIRCICGLFKDEGLMIECAMCEVWQHAECTRADPEIERYLCERCAPREVDLEITLDEYSDEGYQYYLSLLRGSLQIRQTDTVYVLRDIPMTPDKNDPEKSVRKHTYETIGQIDYGDCDIFRVERLWKDSEGKRFVFGHHYLRPHETYHEPSRKFYPNEVVRVPLYEVVPIELIIDRCWVLDTTTYCKGRPVDSVEEHVYICELRVDKGARLFSKISKQSNPVCTKSYAFKKFKQKLKISKSYAPHDQPPASKCKAIPATASTGTSVPPKKEKKRKQDVPIASRKNSTSIVQLRPPPPKTLQEKRQRLDTTLTRLMAVQKERNPNSPEMDLSYLLSGRGARTKSSRAISNAVTSIT